MRKHEQIAVDAIDAKIKKSKRGQHLHTQETMQKNQIPKVKTDNAPTENAFPVGVLPVSLRLLVHEYTRVTGTPTDFLAGGMLTVAGTAIGNSVRGKVGTYDVIAALFMTGVAFSGSGKSHPVSVALKPLRDIDKKVWKEYELLLEKWHAADGGKGKKKTPPPRPKVTAPSDMTPEGLIDAHKQSPNGLLYHREELHGFVTSMNRYSQSGEADRWLEIFDGNPIVVLRKTADCYRIEKPHVSILGNIQPDRLPKLAADDRTVSGFMPRFLFLYPPQCNPTTIKNLQIDYSAWHDCIAIIKQMTGDYNHENPFMLIAGAAAEKVLTKHDEYLVEEWKKTSNDTAKGIFAKLRTYLHRFALILQVMECADTGEALTEIGANAAAGAVKLAQYFQYTARKVHGAISKEALRDHDIRRVHLLKLQGVPVLSGKNKKGEPVDGIVDIMGIPKSTVYDYLRLGKR